MATTRPLTIFSRLILRPTTSHHLSRPLSTTTRLHATTRNPDTQRDAQDDRESINPEANEYAKSGTDASAAKQEEAAFDPSISDPQEAKEKAGEGNEVNPLDASPANVELSQKEGTSEQSSGIKKKMSEGGGGRQGGGDSTGDKYGGSSV